jgi:hypothetical protein
MKLAVAFVSLFLVACSGASPVDVPSPSGTATSTSPTEPGGAPSDDPVKSADGSSDGPPAKEDPPATSTTPDCPAYAAAYCAKANVCGHLAATLFGAACETRMTGICEAHVAAPGTGYTRTALAACTTAFASGTCDLEPTACAFKGTLALNEACAFHDQCTTGACSATSTACGKCVLPAKATPAKTAGLGETCDDAAKIAPACNGPLGLTCESKTKTCVEIPTAVIGEPCGWFGMIVMCETGGTCKPGASGSGTCVAEKAIGDACSASAAYSECAFGTACVRGKCAYSTAAALCK